METSSKHLLLILDGYGLGENPEVSAIAQARTPFIDGLFKTYPYSTLEASGLSVGLPAGQMGNSEVGHMNLGAGRVVYQDITRIDKAIEEGEFFENHVLQQAFHQARQNKKRVHLLGCFSDGGVHSSLEHLKALLKMGHQQGLAKGQVCIHAFTDGRDTDPQGGKGYLQDVNAAAEEIGCGAIVSIIGRYYAMDRDNRWERTQLAYELLTKKKGEAYDDLMSAITANYDEEITDEFVKPCWIQNADAISFGEDGGAISKGDTIIFYNFRADRGRQLTRAFTVPGFDGFNIEEDLALHYVTFTPYDKTFDVHIAFPKINLKQTMGEVIEREGGTQLRAAETEKYPHVTFFFSGGRETPFKGEERILVPSPKVPTYDLQPEMSAPELADRVAEALLSQGFTFAVVNFANPDMVGHTGVFDAAVKAVEAVDAATKKVVEAAIEAGYSISIIADHGNADYMVNPDGSPHTAHTTALVPHILIKKDFKGTLHPGKLGDVAPTILHLLGIQKPAEMDGEVLAVE